MTAKRPVALIAALFLFTVAAPLRAEDTLPVAAKGIYEVWAVLLGDQVVENDILHPQLELDSRTSGHHYLQDDDVRDFHILAHAITAGQLKAPPPWLDEGLAEYFQNMDVQGQRSLVRSNDQYLQALRSSGAPSLQDLLVLDAAGWEGGEGAAYAAQAWALVYFMLQDKHSRYALQDAVRWAHDNPGQPEGIVTALDRAYPGGVLKLERDWHDWLIEAPLTVAYQR